MEDMLKARLKLLAEKYETTSFMDADPSQFTRWYSRQEDVEAACFIAAMLSFGSRSQFIPKIRGIFELADKSGGMKKWLICRDFEKNFDEKSANFERKGENLPKFYRFYSFSDMNSLFFELSEILKENGSFGEFLKKKYENLNSQDQLPGVLADLISRSFPKSKIVPKGKNSANKRIHMFLRWMVRQNSPVDLGLWSWYPASDLLIPLDVHVMQEGIRLGLLPPNAKADRKTALALTSQMAEVFPQDPARADFALFGLGVS